MKEHIQLVSEQPVRRVESYERAKKDMSSLLTVSEVANMLNLHRNTVRRWSDLGVVRAYRLGPRGDRRFLFADITSFLQDGLDLRPSREEDE